MGLRTDSLRKINPTELKLLRERKFPTSRLEGRMARDNSERAREPLQNSETF